MAKQKNPYEIDFEEYIRHTDASKKEKTLAWSTAIGLQQVDGLTPSSYLYETAKRNIEGDISFDEAKRLVDSYYKKKTARNTDEDERTEEADKVASRIAQILSQPSFTFAPSQLIAIHKELFKGLFKFAGKIRDYDITKREWVLNGDTVMYGAAYELKDALDYDEEIDLDEMDNTDFDDEEEGGEDDLDDDFDDDFDEDEDEEDEEDEDDFDDEDFEDDDKE